MGRSGTSLLTGLLSLACGFDVGKEEDLIPPRTFNEKGYFERSDVVSQNIKFLKEKNTEHLDPIMTPRYTPIQNISLFTTKHGQSALDFMNNNNRTSPWAVKDPRLCITLNEWLPFLNTQPAIIITYRHPIEVAKSLRARNKMSLARGLAAWTAYNKALLRNSQGQCIVVTTNDALLQDPMTEINKIVHELTTKCNVLPPPNMTPIQSVVSFVNVSLQHSKLKQQMAASECNRFTSNANEKNATKSTTKETAQEAAMKLYCDMQSGKAFESGYHSLSESSDGKGKGE